MHFNVLSVNPGIPDSFAAEPRSPQNKKARAPSLPGRTRAHQSPREHLRSPCAQPFSYLWTFQTIIRRIPPQRACYTVVVRQKSRPGRGSMGERKTPARRRRVVCIGGGTGQSQVLRGLAPSPLDITALDGDTDNGGHS